MSNQKRIIDATIEELRLELRQDFMQALADFIQKLKPKPQTIWITRDEASKKLGVTKQTLHNWNVSGKLKAHKQGGVVRYKLAEIESFYN